jgi:hypothetical protein
MPPTPIGCITRWLTRGVFIKLEYLILNQDFPLLSAASDDSQCLHKFCKTPAPAIVYASRSGWGAKKSSKVLTWGAWRGLQNLNI